MMSKRNFSILLVVAILATIAVFLVPTREGGEQPDESSLFIPEMAGSVNDLSTVRISSGDGSNPVTLKRTESGWVVQESHDYPADWGVLRPLLAELSQAVIVEEKTSNPEYYYRLGVQDPDATDSESRLIEFPGSELPSIIVGNSAQNRQGHYLRIQGQSPSVLIDRGITLPINDNGWLARDIIDIDDSEVLRVRIAHADGEVVAIERESTEQNDFTLLDIPDGREPASTWTINQLANVLSGLQLESVVPVDDVDWEGATELKIETSHGLTVNAWMVENEDKRWLRLEAAGKDEAAEINRTVSGWAYNIPLYKYDAMTKRMDELLASQDESED